MKSSRKRSLSPMNTRSMSRNKEARSNNEGHCGFNNLPHEIKLQIFSYLRPQELISPVARVCQDWNTIYRDSSLYCHLQFTKDSPQMRGVIKLFKMAPRLASLEIDRRRDMNKLLPHLAVHLSMNRGHLKRLIISNCFGASNALHINSRNLLNVLNHCPELQYLALNYIYCSDGTFFKEIGQLLPKLMSLKVGKAYCTIPTALLSISKRPNSFPFTSLVLRKCYINDTFNDSFKAFCERFQHTLQIVELRFGCDVSDVTLKSLATCHNITTITLSSAYLVTDEGIMALSVLPNLHTLVIGKADEVTAQGWIRFFQKPLVKKIHHLKLVRCDNVDYNVAEAIVQNLSYLERLTLKYCTNITARCQRRIKQLVHSPCCLKCST